VAKPSGISEATTVSSACIRCSTDPTMRFPWLRLGWEGGESSTDMMTTELCEGVRGTVHFKRTGRLLGRFAYRLVIPQDAGDTSQLALEVAVGPTAARRVLACRASGGDASLTLTLEDGRRIDLYVGYRGPGRIVDVTATSRPY
jgi:hypothetical protein